MIVNAPPTVGSSLLHHWHGETRRYGWIASHVAGSGLRGRSRLGGEGKGALRVEWVGWRLKRVDPMRAGLTLQLMYSKYTDFLFAV